ncbi:MAG: glycosyltransferase family 4 protein [Alphaproteobacteria bacterium]|nr:glycosyltransferase family 4 protein [Alphaproteobacteria bacterium]
MAPAGLGWSGLLRDATIVAAAALATAALTGGVRRWLLRRQVLDRPNERSSHKAPTPRGGGIAVLAAVASAGGVLIALGWLAPLPAAVLLALGLGLAALSFIDDLRGLPAFSRLLAHAVAAAAGVALLLDPARPFAQGLLPPWLDAAAAFVTWLWFLNLFNFMDGIDGIAGSETLAIAAGATALGYGLAGAQSPFLLGLAITGAALGFLAWNWHPARIFLGDVGSVPLGYLLGWLLLALAQEGMWAAAVILPLYYLADATITILRRAARGERVWEAHRSHFYQRAVQAGWSHAAVAGRVLATGGALVGLSIAAETAPVLGHPWARWACLAAASVLVAALLRWMATARPRRA